jgi:hypothetical protein
MRCMLPRFTVSALTALMLVLSGCQAGATNATNATNAAERSSPATVQRQLIIKFKPGSVTCDAAGIAAFATTTGTRLEFVRAMSGDACVVRHIPKTSGSVAAEEAALRRQSAIQWLEPDTPLKAQ